MERLGFLQLAKRFLQLGKDATTTPDDADDDRYIQPRPPPTARPPAGRTLSLKIFNRIQQSASASPNGGEGSGGGIASDQPRTRKKFHSVKEGAIHRAGRKENADPRLRIASVGRKHVFAGCRVASEITFLTVFRDREYFHSKYKFRKHSLFHATLKEMCISRKLGTYLPKFTFQAITYFLLIKSYLGLQIEQITVLQIQHTYFKKLF
jgi:hypothetical protein